MGGIVLPPSHAKHLALVPLVELSLFSIFQPDTFVARNIQGEVMVLEIAIFLASGHMHLNNARG